MENTFICEDPEVQRNIGVDALVGPMVDSVTAKVKAVMSKEIGDISDQYFVLQEDSFPYLFSRDPTDPATLDRQSSFAKRVAYYRAQKLPMPPRTIMDVFSDMENDCEEMYRQLDIYYKSNRRPIPSNMTDYRTVTLDTHGKLGSQSEKISKYNDFIDSYTRIAELYRNHTKEQFKIVDLYQLVRILVWYTNNPFIKLQTLFQSLVTREYDSTATNIMGKKQIEEYPRQALCDQRVKEGVFINDSLKRLRSFISASVRKSLSGKTRAPPFLDECVPLQCHPHHLHCFGQESREEDGGPLARLIEKSVDKKKNTFCIFTVVNLSRDANNPPPTPYVDIGPLLTLRESLYPLIPGSGHSPKMQKIEAALRGVLEQMSRVGLQGDPIIQQLEEAWKWIQQGSDIPYYLEELIQTLINHNAITTIGTIEFTDAMAKYGATQITCAPSFVKGQVKQIEQQEQTVSPQAAAKSRVPTFTASLGGRLPTRAHRKANRRTRKKRSA